MRFNRIGVMASCAVSVTLLATSGYAGDLLGPVPASGPPFRVNKNSVTPQHLDMTWGDTCGPDQSDFAVYEGTIGSWYSHTQKLCTTGGALGVSNVTPQAASSYYLIVALSTTSEGSYGKNSVGAEIPVGLSACRATQSFDACAWKRVFVSSGSYQANLNGLFGADQTCQMLADAPGVQLGGTWKAWLSDSVSQAATRLAWSALSYRRLDGVLVATSGTAFCSTLHASPINLDEHGASAGNAEVWTGSGGSGVGSGGCFDWTSTSGAFPAVGLSDHSDASWSNAYLQFCDRVQKLYCIEQ